MVGISLLKKDLVDYQLWSHISKSVMCQVRPGLDGQSSKPVMGWRGGAMIASLNILTIVLVETVSCPRFNFAFHLKSCWMLSPLVVSEV